MLVQREKKNNLIKIKRRDDNCTLHRQYLKCIVPHIHLILAHHPMNTEKDKFYNLTSGFIFMSMEKELKKTLTGNPLNSSSINKIV
jgi:hypothetical protein